MQGTRVSPRSTLALTLRQPQFRANDMCVFMPRSYRNDRPETVKVREWRHKRFGPPKQRFSKVSPPVDLCAGAMLH